MKTSKKLLSVLLTMIMTFSLIFGGLTTAFAAPGDPVADKAVSLITGSNILLVGDYAFDLNSNAYDMNNFLIAAQTAYFNPSTSKYEIYFKVGDIWYDIVSDQTMATPIPDLSKINGDGLFNYMNMVPNPAGPVAPAVTADDAGNLIVGADATMEHSTDGTTWIAYDATTPPTFPGDVTVDVRVAADTTSGAPAGASTTLTFTINSVTPVVDAALAATAVNAGDALSLSTLSGTFKVSATDPTAVAGTLTWDAPTTIVNATGNFAWTFTPTDTTTYTVVTGTVSVTANPLADTTAPVIALLGNATENVANGAAYTDAGATANDNIDGDITLSIATTITNDVDGLGTFDNTKAATYTYHYNVSDAAGNPATEVTRTVIVAAPVTLSSIAITTPATKLIYTVGDALDISGMEVTGTYSDGSTAVEPVTLSDVAGFDSSAPAVDQILTITVGGKTTTYTVTINAALSSANAITSFNFDGLTPAVTGTITGTDIALTVSYGTDVTALVATFTNSAAASVTVGGAAQTSGITDNNFTSPVVYTVTAEDGTTANYTVTVTVDANAAPTASSVAIAGTAEVGQTLTGSYTYSDAESDPEGASTYQWYAGATPITGANAISYVLTSNEQGATITFEVIPVASTGTTTGTPVMSSATSTVAPAPASATTTTITASPTSIVADGSSTSTITVQVKDSTSANVTTGGDTVTLNASDGTIGTVTDNANGTYTATYTSTTTAGTVTISGTLNGSAITSTATINLTAGLVANFTVVPATTTITAGTAQNYVVTALDQYGNTANDYSGTVVFTSSDAQAVLPADSTLTSGVGTFSVTLKTAGANTVTATDTVATTITGTSSAVTVAPGPASSTTSTVTASVVSTGSSTVTVVLKDAYGNTVAGKINTDFNITYTGNTGATVTIGNVTETATPGTYTFTAADSATPETLTVTVEQPTGTTIGSANIAY